MQRRLWQIRSMRSTAPIFLALCLTLPIATAVHALASNADDKPMLWETSWEQLEYKSFDPTQRPDPGVTKQTQVYCARPFRPKLGRTVKDGATCDTTKLSNRNGRYRRVSSCFGDREFRLVSKTVGYDDGQRYDFIVESTLYRAKGKKVRFSRTREKGRLVGECPQGFPISE